ncbi:peptidase [Sphingomonas sp. Leaf33]|uniref:zinc-dependent metalloprotease n=1 Tax=Sphingomonas sp. Leaf33 TaxID=1736215 RepID=UPI0006F8D580|nr:zinc-dependent metalloprotease [Sphingomonas sp. Leaf33]KQN26368.1 peptidase [Sphingomonas sp. Leaf33]
MAFRISVSLLALALTAPAVAQDRSSVAVSRDAPLLRIDADQATGRILLTLPRPDADGVAGRYLYTPALRSGLGAAPTSLDRGKIGETQLIAFRRIGKKIAVQYENPRFRVPNRPDVRSPDFATSVVWMGEIDHTNPDGTIVVDIAPFLASDTLGVAEALGQEGGSLGGGAAQGAGRGFKLDAALSAADPASAKAFPRNVEIDSLQTFTSDTPGAEVGNILPEPRRVTLAVHHSFMALPEPGYVPRRADPRVTGFATQAVDYGVPLGQDVVFDLANRFRLEKTDPGALRSRVKQPIVWYVDPAAPEPIRSALIEGASWWKAGFDAAGYIDAFDVRVLPDGADPLDARYSMITWVDRATRGWAYGQQVTDPRTGEILRGMVVLGSERARQDIQIFQGLVDAALTGTGGPNDPAQVAIARLRQLAAHEVGHSIGFAHNFAASTQGRASVMDYPPPRIGLVDGKPDLSDAYGTGLGGWDMATVDWLYGDDATAEAKAAAIAAKGWRYVPDDNARRADTAQPWGGLWDDGADPVAELDRLMTVRRAAIDRFGERNLLPGEPVSTLRRRFVPIYLLHRYQLVAAAKSVGGVDFAYTVKGDPRGAPKAVPAATQRAAIAAVLRTISPDALRLPPALPLLLSAPRNGTGNRQFDIELFNTAGGPVFDPLVAADTATQLTLGTLLAPGRLQRLEAQHAIDPTMPGVTGLLDAIEAATLRTYATPLSRRIATRAVIAMAQASHNGATPPEAAAMLSDRVHRVATRLAKPVATGDEAAWAAGLSRQLLDPQTLATLIAERPRTPDVPPGDPIGDTDWMGPLGR